MDAVMKSRTEARARVWREKAALRQIYHHLFRRMHASCVPGPILEIGGGLFKEFAPEAVTSDIVAGPALDVVADAQRLPFAAGSFANIVMFDVLHHIEFPRLFFAEAARVLRPRGRLVMVEPALTPVSWPFYRFVHEEAVDFNDDPLRAGEPSPARDPFIANQAIPTLLIGREQARFRAMFPNLRLVRRDWLSLLAYPLSGGFQSWCAIPSSLVAPVLKLEDWVAPLLGCFMAFRVLITMENTNS